MLISFHCCTSLSCHTLLVAFTVVCCIVYYGLEVASMILFRRIIYHCIPGLPMIIVIAWYLLSHHLSLALCDALPFSVMLHCI
jgi:hypothetical protein